MFLGFFAILFLFVAIKPTCLNAENTTIAKRQSVLLDEFNKKIKLLESEFDATISATKRTIIDELNFEFGKLERKIIQKIDDIGIVKQLVADVKKINGVIFDDRVFADESENDRQLMAQRYERCLKRVHADRPISQSTGKPEPVDLNDIVSIRLRNVSGPHFASGTNFKLKPLLLWPNGTVPTDFDGHFTKGESDKIRCAIAFFHGFTCIRFIKRKPYHADYLLISKSKSGCFSETVGKIQGGGYQVINLDVFNDHCWNHGTIVHELMHAVGRFHEHSRMDNKDYIHIHFNNIPQNDHFQYQTPKQMGYDHKDIGYYDYASIMHYPDEMDGKRVISAAFKGDYDQQDRNTDAMGQRNRPSKQDEVKLNMLYNCNGKSTTKMTKVTPTTMTRMTPTTPTTSVELSDHKTNVPVWMPTNDSVCPNGALSGSKTFKLETFTHGKQIPLRYTTGFDTTGWDTMQRAHSKRVCHTKCRIDKDCVRSIWMPENSIHNCATTSWKTIQEQCVTYNKNTVDNIEFYGYWTPYCSETDPCIVKSLMCKCPPGAVKNEIAIMDVQLLCGEKWKESEIFSMLCAGIGE